MTEQHDIFVRAYAIAAAEGNKPCKSYSIDFPKWPRYVLVFDTETRITADQSLTFGVFRLCELKNDTYKLVSSGNSDPPHSGNSEPSSNSGKR
jgi:hypothetical protein